MTESQERSKARKKTKFLEKAKKKHGNRFNYGMLPLYIPDDEKIVLRCHKHGKFETTITSHTNTKNGGCKECRKEAMRDKKALSNESFIAKAKEIHGNKYDYTKVNYINSHTPVTITCPIHGEFQQQPRSEHSHPHFHN